MLVEAFNSIIYGVIILSLFAIDYLLGHGFVDMSQKVICKVMCFVRRVVKEEAKHAQVAPEIPISFSILAVEILVLSCTIAVSMTNLSLDQSIILVLVSLSIVNCLTLRSFNQLNVCFHIN